MGCSVQIVPLLLTGKKYLAGKKYQCTVDCLLALARWIVSRRAGVTDLSGPSHCVSWVWVTTY